MEERSAGGGAVTLEKLEKRFDDEVAVDGVDLQIAAGEFFALQQYVLFSRASTSAYCYSDGHHALDEQKML